MTIKHHLPILCMEKIQCNIECEEMKLKKRLLYISDNYNIDKGRITMEFHNELERINAELSDLMNQIQDSKIMKRKIEASLNAIAITEGQISDLTAQLEKEEKDVEKLKTLSFANFYHSLINDKPEQLQKEEMEVMEVKARIDGLEAEVEAEKVRVDALRRTHSNPAALELEYDKLMEEKTEMVKRLRPELWSDLEDKGQKIDEMKMHLKEVKEASSAGKRALDHVGRIQKSLESAANWGAYDMMGGGLLATMAKRDHLDKAQTEMHQFQHQLKNFNRELKDVGDSIDFDIQIDDFLSFADWFFDGFFVDWAVQSKINDAKLQMRQLEGKIKGIVNKLHAEERQVTAEIERIQQSITGLIRDAG